MRIYISADMEGVTGLVDAGDVQPGGQDTGPMPELFRLISVFISVAAALTGQPPYC